MLDINNSPTVFTDKEVERSMLSAMLSSKNDSAYILDRLGEDDFYFNHH